MNGIYPIVKKPNVKIKIHNLPGQIGLVARYKNTLSGEVKIGIVSMEAIFNFVESFQDIPIDSLTVLNDDDDKTALKKFLKSTK